MLKLIRKYDFCAFRWKRKLHISFRVSCMNCIEADTRDTIGHILKYYGTILTVGLPVVVERDLKDVLNVKYFQFAAIWNDSKRLHRRWMELIEYGCHV